MFFSCTRLKNPAYEDEEISIGDELIPKHVTTEALEALSDNLLMKMKKTVSEMS